MFSRGGPRGYIHPTYIETFRRLDRSGHDIYVYDQIGSELSDSLPKSEDHAFRGHARDSHEIASEDVAVEQVILMGQSSGGSPCRISLPFIRTSFRRLC